MSFERNQKAFEEAVQALSRDMPLLMHGSGDVVPSQVNPDTVRLLSELTVRYIDNLVDAAVDGHKLLTVGVADVKPPPPPIGKNGESASKRRRRPPLPPPPNEKSSRTKRRRMQLQGDFWDDPLKDPLIQPKTTTTTTTTAVLVDDNHYPNTIFSTEDDNQEADEPVHIDEWVGVAGVDLHETNRSRSAHVRMPGAMGVQSFIFPICHDSILFGKVTRLLDASRRTLTPILMDSVLLDLVRTEGALKHAKIAKQQPNKENNNNPTATNPTVTPNNTDPPGADGVGDDEDDEPEQDEEAEINEEETALWPGLEGLLPVHRIIAKRD